MKTKNILILVLLICGKSVFAQLNNKQFKNKIIIGKASFYSHHYEGKLTANGQRYKSNGLTAAHPTLALGSKVKVTDIRSEKSVVVTVNDRCHCKKLGREIDLSYQAAQKLGFIDCGVTKVKIEVL